MATDPRAALAKLLDKSAELAAQQAALIQEMQTLVSGGEGVGAKLKRIFEKWDELWMEANQSEEHFDFKAEKGGAASMSAKVKGWLKDGYAEAKITDRMAAYFCRPDKFARDQRYPFWLFARVFNTLAPMKPDTSTEVAFQKARELRGL